MDERRVGGWFSREEVYHLIKGLGHNGLSRPEDDQLMEEYDNEVVEDDGGIYQEWCEVMEGEAVAEPDERIYTYPFD